MNGIKSERLCKYFLNNGYCFYGDNCQFTHARGKVESALAGDESVITVSSVGSAALLPGVANVPAQLKSPNAYGERSTPSSPHKTNASYSAADDMTRQFQRINFVENSEPKIHIPLSMPSNIGKKEKSSFFVSQQIRMDLLRQRMIEMTVMDPEDRSLPPNVEHYHSLYPLEDPNTAEQSQRLLGYPSTCYKAISSKDALTYCLRRIHGFRLMNPKAVSVIEQWKKNQNTNIVPIKEVFTTKAFGDSSLVFVYIYYPGAESLMTRHFSNGSFHANVMNSIHHNPSVRWGSGLHFNKQPMPAQRVIPERLLWSYIIQLTSAIRLVHSVGLACRIIDPTKILLIGNSRLRLNCLGVMDVLTSDNNPNSTAMISHYQQEDLLALGKLILALACYSLNSVHQENIQQSMEFVARNYSSDLKTLLWHLLQPSPSHVPRSINDVMPVIGARFYSQLDAAQGRCDMLETELSKEMENGRLLRVLTKLGTILERPEFNMDPEWSETGDRYLLKLFRDYVFHQVSENGAPWIDLAHVVSSLNKLDAGSQERICLTSRDEQSALVVSYHDLKACLESAFNDLLQAGQEM